MNQMSVKATNECPICNVTETVSGIIISKNGTSIMIDSRGYLVRNSMLINGFNVKFDTCLSQMPRNDIFLFINEFLDFCILLNELLIHAPKLALVVLKNGSPTRIRHEHIHIQLGDNEPFVYNYLDCDGIETFLRENYPSFLHHHWRLSSLDGGMDDLGSSSCLPTMTFVD